MKCPYCGTPVRFPSVAKWLSNFGELSCAECRKELANEVLRLCVFVVVGIATVLIIENIYSLTSWLGNLVQMDIGDTGKFIIIGTIPVSLFYVLGYMLVRVRICYIRSKDWQD